MCQITGVKVKTECFSKLKIVAFFLSFLIGTRCNTDDQNKRKKDIKNPIGRIHGKQIMTSSGQMSFSKEIRYKGCLFDAVINKNKDTIYLTTNDPKFSTPEKMKVGLKFSQVPVEMRKSIRKENGWGYYIDLDSKWSIGFCEGTSCTNESIKNNSKVKWIFKRK